MKSAACAIILLLSAIGGSTHALPGANVQKHSRIGVVNIEKKPPEANSLLQRAEEPKPEAVAYTNTAALAKHLDLLGKDVKKDIEQAKTHSAKALDATKVLAEKADTFFGVKALKGLDREAHQLRGQLQRRHEWMAKFLDDIIADYQNAKAPQKLEHVKEDKWTLDEPARTGWGTPTEHKPPAAKPWNFGEEPGKKK
mmetsp:Transcript_19580/g.29290  ORF Transcript_19580/g.29290 Transcript_19580/m.29290 type:complete len:197 (-) Transcript_19580:215-805(-)|eukprot:CAMPEP_0194752790 /NCGR_PEP_ID=MMETSP0323_2-20130528/6685_1 /TAXON_ID=2866 ORGANISM="Crypthecodinium cohnii, Strain Seligo" /NCGR_SAMPLE_ID=MMETSP0323_2 /ASSEMBLY_ACC=CAM_ASM_000346 /LENGTH=196 /DNA_ID=CAMNT_0039670087 /DNA_START=79 /DNA_END=669 /DNA_ORIENTATION=+